MTTRPCPACGQPVLVVKSTRWGGQSEAFDPQPGGGEHYNTTLDPDLTHVAAQFATAKTVLVAGRVPLYRSHLWSCPQGCRVPARDKLPGWRFYTHKGG